MPFVDRSHAGQLLAQAVAELDLQSERTVVLGLPRGGVPVAFEVARALALPLDVLVVRKLGVPDQPELAMGAIGEGGARVLDEGIIHSTRVSNDELRAIERIERVELARRVHTFRDERRRVPLRGATAIIVDDGVATGSTARAACKIARAEGAEHVVLAVPVAAPSTLSRLRAEVDRVVCLETPASFHAVGEWYGDFTQTTDAEVRDLLQRAAHFERIDLTNPPKAVSTTIERAHHLEVEIDVSDVRLGGHLVVPEMAIGAIVFVHGSGSGRKSPRNRHVARRLNEAGFVTLLFDLLTPTEELDRLNVFDVTLLAERLGAVTSWLEKNSGVEELPIGYFGASTGAAAALIETTFPGSRAKAVVSRGGRPDLAQTALAHVGVPTLLIVGELDETVLRLNRQARSQMTGETRLSIVPGATHMFEEPGALDIVADLALSWFVGRLFRQQVG